MQKTSENQGNKNGIGRFRKNTQNIKEKKTMKILKISVVAFSLISLISCGPNQKELDKQKQKEDSLMEIERNGALNNADKLLQMQDSIDALNDSTSPKQK